MCHSKPLILFFHCEVFSLSVKGKKKNLFCSQEEQDNRLSFVPFSDVRLILLLHFQVKQTITSTVWELQLRSFLQFCKLLEWSISREINFKTYSENLFPKELFQIQKLQSVKKSITKLSNCFGTDFFISDFSSVCEFALLFCFVTVPFSISSCLFSLKSNTHPQFDLLQKSFVAYKPFSLPPTVSRVIALWEMYCFLPRITWLIHSRALTPY